MGDLDEFLAPGVAADDAQGALGDGEVLRQQLDEPLAHRLGQVEFNRFVAEFRAVDRDILSVSRSLQAIVQS